MICSISFCRRYFEVDKGKSEQSHASSDDHAPLSSAQKLIGDGKIEKAVALLEEALEQFKTSKDLWICYLRVKSQLVPDQYQLFTKAITTSGSYLVILEVSLYSALMPYYFVI